MVQQFVQDGVKDDGHIGEIQYHFESCYVHTVLICSNEGYNIAGEIMLCSINIPTYKVYPMKHTGVFL